MAITNPAQNTNYCKTPSGARLEYQTFDRDEDDPTKHEWTGYTYNQSQLPIQYQITESVGTLIETVNITAGSSATTTATLDKNKFYTFAASGLIIVSGSQSVDALYLIDSGSGSTEPSDRLTTDDELFPNMFFKAADEGGIPYNPFHTYSVGYIGNNDTVTFTMAGSGSGIITIEIYENQYQLEVFQDADPPVTLLDITRNQPYSNLNIACGGDCPTRTSFACECQGERSCYWDDDEGSITKIFSGSANP